MQENETRSRRSDDGSGRISGIEAVSFTATIAFIAALALGFFNAMVPWR